MAIFGKLSPIFIPPLSRDVALPRLYVATSVGCRVGIYLLDMPQNIRGV